MYFESEVWSNKKNQSNASIRGNYIKIFKLLTIELSKKFKVSEATIRDVVARRSWDYTNL
jgi:Mor family transcriptional regulator